MSTDIRLPPKWIELNITKRECSCFIPAIDNETDCQCGKKKTEHSEESFHRGIRFGELWNPTLHTVSLPTDAYGTIVFEGEHHPNKSHYVRISYDSNPEMIIQMMRLVWGLEMPKLVITVVGGKKNFDIPPRVGAILQAGLIKAAKSTGAWILTNGLNKGVTKHIGQALGNERWLGFKRGRVVSIGIAPWGVVEHRRDLLGRNKERIYNSLEMINSKCVLLNPRHSNFLLVDNGTTGKFDGEAIFRRRFEQAIEISPSRPNKGCDTPVICIIIEGGYSVLKVICDYLYDEPPVPVVVFGGTGKTADLITSLFRRMEYSPPGEELESIREEVIGTMSKLYKITTHQSTLLYSDIKKIVKRRNLVTVYNPHRSEDPFDTVILASIFRSQHWSPLQQLSLTLVWDRVDIAHQEVFVYGREWSKDNLEYAMMEALLSDKLDFVNILLEKGLNMQTFLTPLRLETLYSQERTTSKQSRTLLGELAKIRAAHRKFHGSTSIYERNLTLHDIGLVLSHIMGHVYKSKYIKMRARQNDDDETPQPKFDQPFDDLFIWSVLTKRHRMALLLWRHGQGALAKALVAVKINKYLAEEFASSEKTETNMAADFQSHAEEWENLSLELLDSCFKNDPLRARQLLTMELEHWSKQTCLILAVMANHRMLLGQSCCQMLLADLWMGALNIGKSADLKVFLGILLPPLLFLWEYKSTEELKLLPHQERHHENHMAYGMNNTLQFPNYGGDTGQGPATNSKSKTTSKKEKIRKERDANNKRKKVIDQPIIILDPLTEKLKDHHHHHHHDLDLGDTKETQTDDEHHSKDKKVHSKSYHVIFDDKQPIPLNLKNLEENRFSFVTTTHELGWFSKFIEFQRAPITNFYRHTLFYILFICCLTYVIMVPQKRHQLGIVELLVILYVSGLGLDVIREFLTIDAYSMSQRWSEFRRKFWLSADFILVIFFLNGVYLRIHVSFEHGMLMYRISSLYWNLRLYKYMGVHRFVGPKIVMMSRMLKHMAYFAMIILVVLIAFGIARESIRFPNTQPTWRTLAEAFLEPYVMMFGEVDTDALAPQCGYKDQPECPVGHWVIPITWVIYMMVANILIVNVLIAVFNGIYSEVDAIALELWMFQRFTFVMEFEHKPIMPPPLIILTHIYYVLRWFCGKIQGCVCEQDLGAKGLEFEEGRRVIMGYDHSLKIFLSPTEANQIFDFEEDNIDGIRLDRAARVDPSAEKFEGKSSIRMSLKDIYTELESQKSKLDKLVGFWELKNSHAKTATIPAGNNYEEEDKD